MYVHALNKKDCNSSNFKCKLCVRVLLEIRSFKLINVHSKEIRNEQETS